MRGAKQSGFEYRIRYRREYGKEKVRTFGTLKAARQSLERVRNYESDDPMFPAERLLYAAVDRRVVGEWDRTWEDDRR